MTTYRFRYFGKGEFGWRKPALQALANGDGDGPMGSAGTKWDFAALAAAQIDELPSGLRATQRPWEHPVPEVEQDRVDPRGVHTMIAQSMYAYGVQRWLDVGFKLEQFMLVTQEDLASDPAGLSGPPGAF